MKLMTTFTGQRNCSNTTEKFMHFTELSDPKREGGMFNQKSSHILLLFYSFQVVCSCLGKRFQSIESVGSTVEGEDLVYQLRKQMA